MTTRQKDAIIIKLSGERKAPQASGALLMRTAKKYHEKDLTKVEKSDILKDTTRQKKVGKKTFKKTSEKGLTNERKCGIINELSDENG